MVPASMVKLATALVAFQEIAAGKMTLETEISISENAWRKGGARTDGSYSGSIKTLTLNVKAKFVPAEGESERGPDYRIFAGATEFGAAWKKTSQQNRDYLSVKLDDPSFTAPIFANLFDDEDGKSFNLIWSRARRTVAVEATILGRTRCPPPCRVASASIAASYKPAIVPSGPEIRCNSS